MSDSSGIPAVQRALLERAGMLGSVVPLTLEERQACVALARRKLLQVELREGEAVYRITAEGLGVVAPEPPPVPGGMS